jgi:hypothetical protein
MCVVASTAYFNLLHAIADSTSHVTVTQLPHWKKNKILEKVWFNTSFSYKAPHRKLTLAACQQNRMYLYSNQVILQAAKCL